ncbi:MAG: DUF3488 domain-containing protein [Planctomycetes bacterium]|nr:DUF3488 domain-containing protein [Planctomycetota bacterium]
MADALRPLLLVLVLMNLAFVQITDTVSAGWMLPLWTLAIAAPVLCRLQERWLYRLVWNLGVIGAFGWLLRHALTSGLLHMLEDGLLLAALCQVHLLNNVGRRQRPDLLFFNSFLIAFVTSFFSADVSWSIVFVGYAATLVPALQLFIVVRAGGAAPGITGAVLRDSLPRTLAVLIATALVFAFWPRDFERQGFIDHALRLAGAGQVAFDEPIRLGGDGAVSLSDREVLRIAPTDGNPESVPAHWRGATYVEFDGSGWDPYQVMDFGSRRATDPLWQADEPHRWRRPWRPSGTTLRVRLLDDRGERLFAPLATAGIELLGPSTTVVLDPKGDAVLAYQFDGGGASLEYRLALGTPEPRQRFRVGTAAELRLRSVSLAQLPNTLLDLANVARATLPDDASPAVIAEGCRSYLQEHRRYALPGTAGAARHLGEFVLGTGAGHCEYFATTLALMLRVLGIPCRVVGGYLATEWSEATREVVVREKHAHAWVEALLPGSVWTTLDATPASELQPAVNEPSTWQSLTTMLREGWASITGFDGGSRTAALAWLRNLPGSLAATAGKHPLAVGVAIALLAGFVVWRRSSRQLAPAATRLLRQAIAAAGLRQLPGETPRELLIRARGTEVPPDRLQALASAIAMHETMRYRATAQESR